MKGPVSKVQRPTYAPRKTYRSRPKAESLYTSASACKSPGHSLAKPGMFDFLAERIEPAANTETLSESALYTGCASWCRASGREALSAAEFVDGFDRLRADNQAQGSLLRHPLRHLLISRDSG